MLAKLFADEDAARAFIERQRWPNGPVCPHCGSTGGWALKSKARSKSQLRPGLYGCKAKACRKPFTVTIGTIFEDSHIPLSKWLMAIHMMTSSQKPVRSLQIKRELGVGVTAAWYMTQRVREAMKREPMASILKGIVEADEACTEMGRQEKKPRAQSPKSGGRMTRRKYAPKVRIPLDFAKAVEGLTQAGPHRPDRRDGE
jgi:transposase-like protein